MKLKSIIIIIFSIILSACNSKPSEEKTDIFDGTYQITESGLVTGTGIWVFSKNEISIFNRIDEESSSGPLVLTIVLKYYVKDDYIYACNCILNDCSDKGRNFEKDYKIESVNQTNSVRTIILTGVKDPLYKIKLQKNKDIGLNVKENKLLN